MKAIQIIAQDLFDKIRSRFSNLEMGDESGAVTIDPAEARFFDFDFVSEGTDLGRVSISLNNLGSLKIYYSQGITENQDAPAKKIWYNFLKEMRMFAMRRLLRFDTRDIAKTNLDKNDFQHLAATQGPKEEPEMNTTMNESRWSQKSTTKTSRAVKGNTEVIVRHANPVDEEYAGSRSQRKNIKAIFIQNKDGERFKYPFIHPAGAFAMAQHVDHGGIPHDPAGKAIIQMSEQIAQLQEFQRKIQRTSLHDDAMGITERAVGRLQELKLRVEALSKRHHYESWMAEFNEQESPGDDLQELDAVTMEEYRSKFTETNFKEELTGFFPLLHSIMREANKVNLEDYVEEAAAPWETDDEAEAREKDGKKEPSPFKKPNNPNRTGNDTAKALAQKGIPKKEGFAQFEEWADATEQGKLTDDQIAKLKQALTDLPEGQLDLDTAYSFFNEFGINDEDLADKFQQAKALDNTADPVQIFQLWAKESYPELLVALGMSGTEAPAEPAPEVGAEPAPEQPVAEGPADEPVHPDNDADDKRWDDMEEGNEGKGGKMTRMVAEKVKSFYNISNEDVAPFRAEENIATEIKKDVEEQFGEEAGEQAREMALAFMEKKNQEWKVANGHGDDGLARLKELVGNIKAKVEAVSGQGNSMPAEEDIGAEGNLVPGKFYVMSSPSGKEGESPDNPSGGFDSAEEAEEAKHEIFQGHPEEMITGIPVMQWNGKQFVPPTSPEMESMLKLAGLAK